MNLSLSNLIYFIAIAAFAVGFYYFLNRKKSGVSFPRSGPTPYLNQFAVDFTLLAAQGKIDPVIGRADEVRRLTQVLSRRSKNNALLIGAPGVGKTAIVEGLAQLIARSEVPEALKNKRVLALDVASLMSGTKYRGEFEARAKKIVNEITTAARSIILFIDETHSVIQSQGTEGAINFSDILKPALARGDLQMIGATTKNEYEKFFKTDLSLERRFQPIEINEPSLAETVAILQGVKDKYRDYHKVEFTDAALQTAVALTVKLVGDRKLPDKAIDAIDEAAAMVKVAHLHPSLPAVLYQVAAAAHPEVAALWKQIQELDKKISNETAASGSQSLITEREQLEEQLSQKGLVVVDTSDVEKVIKEWV